ILKVMAGKPVVIRLIDPPLHEFLPNLEELVAQTAVLRATHKQPAKLHKLDRMLARVLDLHEANPMLGLRGVRLSVLFPEIPRMQVRAIMEAACELRKRGIDARPEVMIPLVGTLAELQEVHALLKPVAEDVQKENGVGRLMELAVREGRKTRPKLEVGICGEHGGDPDSIHLCHRLNLNYVSCSPFRVPVARLAAAQAAIGETTSTR